MKDNRYGAFPQDWEALGMWARLSADLLPVVSNPNAPKSPGSAVESPGKTPTEYNSQGLYRGINQWTSKQSNWEQIAHWLEEPDYGICLQTRRVRALDVDVADEKLAECIATRIGSLLTEMGLPSLPKRWRGNSGKFLLAFQLQPGEPMGKRKVSVDGGIIEFLATGQQFIAVGTHPSGVRYQWDGGTPESFPVLSAEQFELIWTDLCETFGAGDAVAENFTARTRGTTVAMEDLLFDHLHEHSLVLGITRGGAALVECPWATEHTPGSPVGNGSTVYFPAGTQGHAYGAFKCLHAHCTGRTTRQFGREVGYTPPQDDPNIIFGHFVDVLPEVMLANLSAEHEAHMEELRNTIMDAKTISALEREIAPSIARSERYRDSDRERIAIWMQKRTGQLDGKLPIGTVRAWLEPRGGGMEHTFPDVRPDGTRRGTIINVKAVGAKRQVGIAYNVIAKRQEVSVDNVVFTQDNYDNESLTWLYSACLAHDIPMSMPVLKAYVSQIAGENQYNPVADWICSEPWDGVDRLPRLYETLEIKPGFDEALAHTMVRKWLVQAVAAALSERPIQTRGVLVVQGEQYIGKSMWLKSLTPDHEDLVITGRTVDPHNKDSVKTAISYWLCEFGELDATFRKADIAALKAFMSQDTDTLRLPYAALDSKFQRRTVFYGSVNADQFLADDTGNTRFWVIPVLSMNHMHGIEMQQLWAQVESLWRGGEQHWMTQEQMAQVNQSADAFQVEDSTWEIVAERFAWDEAKKKPKDYVWSWLSASEIQKQLDAELVERVTVMKIGKVLKKMPGVEHKATNSVTKYKIPVGLKVSESSKPA